MNRQNASAAAMAALLAGSAVNHFRNPRFYHAVVPRSISADTDGRWGILGRRQWTHLSGALEVAAAGLLPAIHLARLPLQAPLIRWAWSLCG